MAELEVLNKPPRVPRGSLVASNQRDLPQYLEELSQQPRNLRPVELLAVPSASRLQLPQEVSEHDVKIFKKYF